MDRGTVPRQPFLQALCSSLLRRACPGPGRPECASVHATRCYHLCRPSARLSSTRSLSVGGSVGQNPGMRSGVSRASSLLLTAPPGPKERLTKGMQVKSTVRANATLILRIILLRHNETKNEEERNISAGVSTTVNAGKPKCGNLQV
ncbi:hypothetical protein NDU88_003572 [Pleurodeles waltl]|uniref:Uncharacterized protein n=1 Tax=Pleurodeles waltl TaxID=8319 RepID=A0AAV7UYS9_PLEWA|nr:hypothetical protein NDU88_003572 [Pleurodeles waltl]